MASQQGGGAAGGGSSNGSGNNNQVASSSNSNNGQQQQQGEGSSKDSQDPQFIKLQTAAQLLSSRANTDSRIEQATELSEVLNCQSALS